MLIGPVFRAELVRNARRRSAYWLRLLYGLALLLLLRSNHASLAARGAYRGLYLADLASFAETTFFGFMVLQITVLLALIPALCGTAVVDEKQRKTLHYLMASQLTSREIVLDKLLARLLNVGVYVLLGMPVMSFLGLFGGVAWELVLAGYAATFSIAFFASALAVLVSVLARRVRQAVLVAYLLEIGWLIGPPLLAAFVQLVFTDIFARIGPFAAYGMNSSPVSLYVLAHFGGPFFLGGPAKLLPYFELMIGLQLAGGLLMLGLSVVLLRPIFRRQAETPRRLNWFTPARSRRAPRRRACGDDAMLWKESHFTRTDVFTKLVVLPATVVLTVGLILGSQLDEAVGRMLTGVWEHHQATADDRERIAAAVVQTTAVYTTLWLLAIAGASASCVTVEREQDTWISLIASPLNPWEIMSGKILGAVWGLRGFGVLLLLFWFAALVLGALSLAGFALGVLALTVFTAFVAALGAQFSLRARSTGRSLLGTLAVLVILNGGCLVPALPLWAGGHVIPSPHNALVYTPGLIAQALVLPDMLASVLPPGEHMTSMTALLVPIVLGTMISLLYAAAAVILTVRTATMFDRVNDRPSDLRQRSAGRSAHTATLSHTVR